MEHGINELTEFLANEKWQIRYKAISSLINLKDSSALENVKKILNEDENEHVREIAVEYLKFNKSFPLKPISPEKVKLYPFSIKNTYTLLHIISVTSDPILSENAAKENIKYELKREAAQLGANAVIKINCGRKFLLFGQYKARGYAVIIHNSSEKLQLEKSTRGIWLGILYIMGGLSFLFDSTFNPINIFFLGMGFLIFAVNVVEIKYYSKDKFI